MNRLTANTLSEFEGPSDFTHGEKALLTGLGKDNPDLNTDATFEPEEDSADDDEQFENDDVIFDMPDTASAAPTVEGQPISQRGEKDKKTHASLSRGE